MVSSAIPQSEHTKERLKSELIAWFTTVRADGRPHSIPVWFLWEGESILIFSKPNNQKIRNLRQNSNVVLALDNTQGGDDVIILEGKAQLLPGEGEQPDTTLATYVEKYGPHIKDIGFTPASMAQEYSQAIRVTITRFTSQ
ncbi:pyridoxamine 5'-phosphate oxidase family protein [Ktedonospora formicarum]|uniref:Pyridoxamine 5'-phosphate oxidase N-terminal domain-containing protein n=1 Tax=Ktedonospora formicarum TaxID=2778364 RepID=A0A8J3IA52_9CHLR|nr:pyridoxamine 5'-phosphate oxidase family protein [Ktedonospora formicarum]GHO50236.1 hypothetical protein KSX_83990 [Ktedonospora formicarum]